MELLSTIHCPQCGFKKEEMMPTNACQVVYVCANCGTTLRPLPDRAGWQAEFASIGDYLDEYGPRMPEALKSEQQRIVTGIAK